MKRDKRFVMRLTVDEQARLKSLAGTQDVAEFARERILSRPLAEAHNRHTGYEEDWQKLAEALGDDFLDKLAWKSGAKNNFVRQAVYLLGLMNGVSHETHEGSQLTPQQVSWIKYSLPTVVFPSDCVARDFETKEVVSFEFDQIGTIGKEDWRFPYLLKKFLGESV